MAKNKILCKKCGDDSFIPRLEHNDMVCLTCDSIHDLSGGLLSVAIGESEDQAENNYEKSGLFTDGMQLHIGTKIVLLAAMTRQLYNDYRGWKLPADENGADEGYLVEYLDGGKPNHPDHEGYISWSPKAQADAAYRPADGMTFGLATDAAKMGKRIARKGWNGADMFAYIVPANTYAAQTEIIKSAFPDGIVPYRQYWALKTAQNDIAMWAPSGSDSLAEDWYIVE